MPNLVKILHVLGLLAKEETTNYTFTAVSNTLDGVQLQYANRYVAAPMDLSYANDGDLGPSVSALGQIANVAPSGLMAKGDLPFRVRPGGAAYSASVQPSGHRMLKAGGLTATLIATGGSESWTYAPSPAGLTYTTLSAEVYSRLQKLQLAGVIGSLKFDASDTKPAIWTLAGACGIPTGLPTDAATPAITYPNQTVPPPLSSSVLLTLGNLLPANAVVYAHSWDFQRAMTPRVAQSGGGAFLGMVPGDFNPIVKITVEASALVTGSPYTSTTAYDPYRLRDTAQIIAMTLKKGSVQYFRETLNAPQCQVIDVKESNKDGIPTFDLTLQLFNSTASANDSFSLVWD